MTRFKTNCWQPAVFVAALAAAQLYCASVAAEPAQPAPAAASATAPAPTKPPFRVARGTSRFLQKYSGLNWMTQQAASGVASAALSLKTGGFVRARVRTYSFTDLLDGEFKSVDVKFKGSKYKGMPLGNLHVASQGPFKVRYSGRRAGLRTPLLLCLSGQAREADVSRALKSDTATAALRFLKLDLPGLGQQHLQVLEPQVELTGGKVHVNSWLVTAGAPKETGIKLDVVATPEIEGERRVMLKDLQVSSADIENPQAFSGFASELLNPLIDLGRMDRQTHAFRLEKLNINDEKVDFAGRLLLAPKPKSPALPALPVKEAQPAGL